MKEWLKSRTIWIAGIIEAIGIGLIFVQPLVAMIPGDWGIKAVGIVLVLVGIQQQIMRVLTKTGLTSKKNLPPVA